MFANVNAIAMSHDNAKGGIGPSTNPLASDVGINHSRQLDRAIIDDSYSS